MKLLAPSILLTIAYLLTGCASTSVMDPQTGRKVFATQADATNVTYSGPGYSFHADSLNHSRPTIAGGISAAKVLQSTGTMAGAIGGGVATAGIRK
jgi:hypothetical protein